MSEKDSFCNFAEIKHNNMIDTIRQKIKNLMSEADSLSEKMNGMTPINIEDSKKLSDWTELYERRLSLKSQIDGALDDFLQMDINDEAHICAASINHHCREAIALLDKYRESETLPEDEISVLRTPIDAQLTSTRRYAMNILMKMD